MVEKEEKRSTKEVFLTEALKLFARGGYEAVTVSQIAEAVNVSAPALYKHYKNKKELFEAVLELGEKGFAHQMTKIGVDFDKHPEKIQEYIDMTPDQQIERMQQLFSATLHDEYPALMRKLMTVEQFHMADMARTYNERYVDIQYNAHASLFKNLMQAGKMKEADPYTLAVAYCSPVIVLIGLCDREPDREPWALEVIKNHIEEFNKNYRL